MKIFNLFLIICWYFSYEALSVSVSTEEALCSFMEATCPGCASGDRIAPYSDSYMSLWQCNTNKSVVSGYDPCSPNWYGLSCDGTDTEVISISLSSLQLTGKLIYIVD